MASTEPQAERELGAGDIPAALQLSAAAGWNQIAGDWAYMLERGTGFGIAVAGELAATAIALPYGPFGWISMVLVRDDQRRRGFASQLLQRCMEHLRARGCVPAIDATPAGHPVHATAGFADVWAMKRMRRMPATAPPPAAIAFAGVRPMRAGDRDAVARLDRATFGAERTPLLDHLRGRLPKAALVVERDGSIAGFLFGRNGRTAAQLGPLVADDLAAARALLDYVLPTQAGPIVIDVPDAHPALAAWLAERGFTVERPLTRMLYGRSEPFDRVRATFAISGPELG